TYNSENNSEKNELYNQLSAEKKGQFDELVSNLNLSEQELIIQRIIQKKMNYIINFLLKKKDSLMSW
ncbi:hypothetical protein CSW77_26870, partial [Shigella flexneri]|uniref:hypothetical protein n=1 Tax=Shigella flexneri TaxID=623 RepID=UPI000C122533